MLILTRLSNLWRNLFRRDRVEQELDDELRTYLELLTEAKVKQGFDHEEARRQASIELGGVEQVKEKVRDIRMGHHIETLWQDLRFGTRMLGKKPGFTFITILTLALGIGANTAIFSVVHGVLLKPLPYSDPDQLVAIYESSKKSPRMAAAYPNYLDWHARQSSFTELSARMPAGGVLTGGEPERVTGRLVSASFFRALGVQPQVGRAFTEEEDRPGGERVIVLGHSLWQHRFGGDESLIGKAIEYNAEKWTVVGVMPAGFDFYGQNNLNNQFFIPLGHLTNQEYMHDRRSHPVMVIGRLKPGVTLDQAQAEMQAISAQLGEQFPSSNAGNVAQVRRLSDDYVGEVRPALLMISVAVALVLLIACANVTNLTLARAMGRQKEIAVRVALGAPRGRVIRQLLTEGLLLSMIAAVIGVLLAFWGNSLLLMTNPDGIPRLEEIGIDLTVLGFTTLVTVLSALLCGLAPALRSVKVEMNDVLKEGGRRSGGGAGGQRLRNTLVISEVALCMVLLLGAGLLLKSFRQLMQVEAGFDARNVLTLRLRLPDAKYREAPQAVTFLNEVTRRVASLPGVNSVSIATGFPLGRGGENSYWLEGEPEPQKPEQWAPALTQSVSETYNTTLGITLLAGRDFTAQDAADSIPVVVVDDMFVERHSPGSEPVDMLGKRLRFGGKDEPWRVIVGVVRQVRHYGLEEEGRPGVYRPWMQMNPKWLADYSRAMDLIVKGSVEPGGLVGAIKKEVQAVDKDQPLANIATLEDLLSRSVAPRRFSLQLLELFALIALVLSAAGLYGVIAYSVAQRTHEIGIRMALGASRGDVLRMVIGQGIKLVAIGVCIGVIAALALTQWIESLLFRVSATDPATFTAIPVLLIAVGLLACYIPARRATKVDPLIALRYE